MKDVIFTELPIQGRYPIVNWSELLDAIKDGYFPTWCEVPDVLMDGEDVIENKHFSKKRLKIFCKRLFDKYGNKSEAERIHYEFSAELEGLDEDEVFDVLTGNPFIDSIKGMECNSS